MTAGEHVLLGIKLNSSLGTMYNRVSGRQIISHTPDMPAGPWPWSKAGFLSFVLAEK